MKLKVKIDFKEYFHLLLRLTYKKFPIRFFTLTVLFVLFIGIVTTLLSLMLSKPERLYNGMTTSILGLVLASLPMLNIYLSAKRVYKTEKILNKEVEYEFTEEMLHVRGDTFHTALRLDSLLKTVKMKDWLLIHETKLKAFLIPMRYLDEEKYKKLMEILPHKK